MNDEVTRLYGKCNSYFKLKTKIDFNDSETQIHKKILILSVVFPLLHYLDVNTLLMVKLNTSMMTEL